MNGSPRFILIDQSLRKLGGHHLEYDSQILAAAEDVGFRPVVVAHARLPRSLALPSRWQVLRLYPDSCYDFRRLRSRIVHRAKWWEGKGVLDLVRLRIKELRFRMVTRAVLRSLSPSRRDVVFYATVDSSELRSLAAVYSGQGGMDASRPQALCHFPLHESRELPSPEDARFACIGKGAVEAERSGVRIHATNGRLAQQFRALGASRCEELPWVVRPSMTSPRSGCGPGSRPIRVLFPSAPRGDRGPDHVGRLFHELGSRLFDGRRAQLVVQAASPEQLPASLRSRAEFHRDLEGALASRSPLVALRWPLPDSEYESLVRSADLGVLPYCPEHFYARASGTLVEFLGGGTPVVVLAGTWLGQQFRLEALRHAERVCSQGRTLDELMCMEGPVRIDGCGTRWQVSVPAGLPASSLLALTLTWISPSSDEGALIVEVDGAFGGVSPESAGASTPAVWRELIERRPPGHDSSVAPGGSAPETVPQTVLLPVVMNGGSAVVRMRCLCPGAPVKIAHVRLSVISASADGPAPVASRAPLSAVGLQAADPAMLAPLVAEACENHPHYRETAERFADVFRQRHLPSAAVSRLVELSRQGRDSVAPDRGRQRPQAGQPRVEPTAVAGRSGPAHVGTSQPS